MSYVIKKAKRSLSKIRLALFGPPGAGKTMSALKLAYGLCGDWSKVLVIDTERGSASLYDHLGAFETIELESPFSPENYVGAIKFAEQNGAEVIVIDSASHEWDGKGGCLEIHEQETNRSTTKNSYTAWSKVTPRHNAFIEAMLQSKAHIIVCYRSKVERVLEEQIKNGRTVQVPKEVGMKAITREGIDYEMTICFDLDKVTHLATATKDRTELFHGLPDEVISEQTGVKIRDWLNSATPKEATQEPVQQEGYTPTSSDSEEQKEIKALKLSINKECQNKGFKTIQDIQGFIQKQLNKIQIDTLDEALLVLEAARRQPVQAPAEEG